MLEKLEFVEKNLSDLLSEKERGRWKTLFIDYEKPWVERVWCQFEEMRVNLHRIHPCADGEALFHPHPWPSAMKILAGKYEMAIGYGERGLDNPPKIAAKLEMGENTQYEMVEPNAWHYVRPINRPVMSLMVTGTPWNRGSTKRSKTLVGLESNKIKDIFSFFQAFYGR
jgi:hypothetical protein